VRFTYACFVTKPAVGSYPTFSPLPEGGYFLWHWLLNPKIPLPVRKHAALCCSDFPL
jgi:hypothetical protein